ncbi:hypothetical protein TL16_g04114 [Triparma laevis f. inornata]|uniref:Uncharacterized protein n=1 Tax=Triparma laevis f. inornata TaxID=1714386 RepID=A0A9W7A3D4_9STRA|nr:hypothetical protein TL16_g04114 [Triparma laevis f. inornata]
MSRQSKSFTMSGGKITQNTPKTTQGRTPGSSRASDISRRLSSILTPKTADFPTPSTDTASKENQNNNLSAAKLTTSTTPNTSISNARRLSNILRQHTTPNGTSVDAFTPSNTLARSPGLANTVDSANSRKSTGSSFQIPSLSSGKNPNLRMSLPKAVEPMQMQMSQESEEMLTQEYLSQSTTNDPTLEDVMGNVAASPIPMAPNSARKSMDALRNLAKSAEKKTPSKMSKTPTKSPADIRTSNNSTTKLLLSSSKRRPTDRSLTTPGSTKKRRESTNSTNSLPGFTLTPQADREIPKTIEVTRAVEAVETVVASAPVPAPVVVAAAAPVAVVSTRPSLLLDTSRNYNTLASRRQTLGAGEKQQMEDTSRRHTMSQQPAVTKTLPSPKPTPTAAAPLPAPVAPEPEPQLDESNFEDDVDSTLPPMGGSEISVDQIIVPVKKSKKSMKKSRKSSLDQTRLSILPSPTTNDMDLFENKKKSRMSIGQMLQMDKNGDFYYFEALKSEVRRTEADGDILMMMEENRKLKIALIKEQVQSKINTDAYNLEQEEALAFINDRAAEYTKQRYTTQEKHEQELNDLNVTLQAERTARAANIAEIKSLKKKLGQSVDSDSEDSDDETDSDDEAERMEVARVLASRGRKSPMQKKWKSPQKKRARRRRTPTATRATSTSAWKATREGRGRAWAREPWAREPCRL